MQYFPTTQISLKLTYTNRTCILKIAIKILFFLSENLIDRKLRTFLTFINQGERKTFAHLPLAIFKEHLLWEHKIESIRMKIEHKINTYARTTGQPPFFYCRFFLILVSIWIGTLLLLCLSFFLISVFAYAFRLCFVFFIVYAHFSSLGSFVSCIINSV